MCFDLALVLNYVKVFESILLFVLRKCYLVQLVYSLIVHTSYATDQYKNFKIKFAQVLYAIDESFDQFRYNLH